MRIVSLVPAATEILYAIGAGDSVVGVSHECDFPPEAARKPILVRPRVDPSAPPAAVDRQVAELVRRGESIYAVDADRLVSLAPDLLVAQDLCHVCAASPEDLAAALAKLPGERMPRIVTFAPHSLGGVWDGIREIGAATACAETASALADQLTRNVAATARATARVSSRPGVLCLEWFDPPYVAGHWVPEMVRLAGGRDVLGREGEPSFPVAWRDILSARPDVVVLMACGYNLERNCETFRTTRFPGEWNELPAVDSGRIYAVDANAFFSRSGPRLAEGVALLAALLHPRQVSATRLLETGSAARQLGASAAGPS